jgi:hypothetical protein
VSLKSGSPLLSVFGQALGTGHSTPFAMPSPSLSPVVHAAASMLGTHGFIGSASVSFGSPSPSKSPPEQAGAFGSGEHASVGSASVASGSSSSSESSSM